MPVVAVLGSLLLAGVFLVRPGKNVNLWGLAAILVIVPMMLTQIAGVATGRFGGVFPEAKSEQLLRSATAELGALADDPPDYVIIIEGASWSSRGVAGPRLESDLREMGIDASVVQVTLPAGNHFEREYLLRTLAKGLTDKQITNLSETNVVLLREIARTYDTNPLTQVTQNLFTDRVYAYSAPARAYTLAKAALAEARLTPLLAAQLGQHAAFNWLRIGEVQRFETPYEKNAVDGYRPLNTTELPPPIDRVDEIIAFIESDEVPDLPDPAWSDIKRSLSEGTFGLPVDLTVSFETPTWNLENARHARWVGSQGADAAILIDDPALYRSLADVDLWKNVGHLRSDGAEIYTSWLAERLADLLGAQQ